MLAGIKAALPHAAVSYAQGCDASCTDNKYTSKYLDVANTPQYAFGYGLSYTTFALSSLRVPAVSVSPGGTLTVSADITNTGSVAGDDVVQLYTHQDGTTILQPVRRLNGFQRVTLAPGQTRTVTFTLGRGNIWPPGPVHGSLGRQEEV